MRNWFHNDIHISIIQKSSQAVFTRLQNKTFIISLKAINKLRNMFSLFSYDIKIDISSETDTPLLTKTLKEQIREANFSKYERCVIQFHFQDAYVLHSVFKPRETGTCRISIDWSFKSRGCKHSLSYAILISCRSSMISSLYGSSILMKKLLQLVP